MKEQQDRANQVLKDYQALKTKSRNNQLRFNAALLLGAIVIVGFDPATRMLRFAHSWGEQWGDRGFGTMSLQTAQLLIDLNNTWAVEAATER